MGLLGLSRRQSLVGHTTVRMNRSRHVRNTDIRAQLHAHGVECHHEQPSATGTIYTYVTGNQKNTEQILDCDIENVPSVLLSGHLRINETRETAH